jgi:hypothetical protein
MANLDKSNVVNGNIISASDVTALYDTFTGDNTANNINILGNNNNFAGTASKAENLRYLDGSSNHEYPVTFVTGSAQYKTAYVDSNDGFTFNPSTNTLNVTSSFITGSNVEGVVEIAQNLNTFQVIDTNQIPIQLLNPRPIAFTLEYSGPYSGSIDLNNVIPGIQSITLGDDLFILAQEMSSPGIINTVNSLEINYNPPFLAITSSSPSPVFGALVTGWASGA